jgi:cytochrome c-type biogenesis protein
MSTELYGTLVFAFGAGTATFFAPCVYALLPGYVGYYAAAIDGDSVPLSGAAGRGVAATVGALCTFAVLSVLALAAGELLESILPLVERLIGLLLIGLGGVVLWRGTLSLHVQLPERRASVIGFGLFGALYALAATACVLPLFLAVSIQSFALSTLETLLVLGAYAGSFALLMLAVTVAIAVGYDALADRARRHGALFTRIAGVVLVLAGIGQLYFALTI